MNLLRLHHLRRSASATRNPLPSKHFLSPTKAAVFTLCAWLLCLCAPALAAHDVSPDSEIPLNPLGYETALPDRLADGSAMATLDYVDASHVLVTFALRDLIPRDKDDPPGDNDRLVGAYLLELPSGKLVAQTKWHLHDRGHYLWNLGHGHFLLRIRNHLALLAPGLAAHPQDAFTELPFLHFDNEVVAINVSPANDLLVIQTASPTASAVSLGDSDQNTQQSVVISFYRLSLIDGRVAPTLAGMVRSPTPVILPISADGIVYAAEVSHDRWQFRFSSPTGILNDLAQFDTSCSPQATLVSQTEFIAFGCRGSQDRTDIAAFDMNGNFMWQQSYSDARFTTTYSFAPPAGRFAIGRTLFNSSGADLPSLTAAEITGQEVRVYQTSSGKVLLELDCTPAMRAGQNFALSPDGSHLAVLRESTVQHKATKLYDAYTSRETAIAFYNLPPLTRDDQAALNERHKFPPPGLTPRLDLAILALGDSTDSAKTATVTPAAPASSGSPQPQPPTALLDGSTSSSQNPSAPSVETPAAATASPAQPLGDTQTDQPRKPPTLYAPGEAPQGSAPESGHPNP